MKFTAKQLEIKQLANKLHDMGENSLSLGATLVKGAIRMNEKAPRMSDEECQKVIDTFKESNPEMFARN